MRTTVPEAFAAEPLDANCWPAGLRLQFDSRGSRTTLRSVAHYGPLRVQRPFYPEGAVCHLYLLHPPGGMVAGDHLTIDVAVEHGAQVLLTTPAAGKFYRVAAQAPVQYQGVAACLEQDAVLEWLPQETIVFNGARGRLSNRFELGDGAVLIGWDIVCLGRRASGERFDRGDVRQCIEIYRNGRPLFIDRVHFVGGSAMLDAPWGLQSQSVSGTFFATLPATSAPLSPAQLDEWRSALPAGREWGLTCRNGVLLARYLGHSSETCRRGFEALWHVLRPQLLDRPALRPRIWNT